VNDQPLVKDFATDWDHADPQWVADPYPIWEHLRQHCPVAHTDRYGGGWFPATHAGVSAIAKDTKDFTSRTVIIGNGRPTELDLPAPIGVAPPITSDPPFHAIARKLILPAFAPGPINALEPMIRELCAGLIDGLDGDVINAGMDYAKYIPPSVIRLMLGFPPEDIEKFIEFINIVLEGIDHPVEQRIEEFAPVEATTSRATC
jgi:cytochrome P450